MTKYFNSIRYTRLLSCAVLVTFLAIFGLSCSKDDNSAGDPPDNTLIKEKKKFMFCYNKKDVAESYCTRFLNTTLGSSIQCSQQYQLLCGWQHMAGVQVGNKQFVIGHNGSSTFGDKYWEIYEVHSNGLLGEQTDFGDSHSGAWQRNYETFFGFHVGTRGFVFGQDSYGDKRWFVQEVTANGVLASGESDSGNWNNYYASATPFYIGSKTYIFFQTDNDEKYWFISSVSPDGKLTDVCDGYWANFWDAVTAVESGGTTYLIGHRRVKDNSYLGEYFIQVINNNGTMGVETDRGRWKYHYHILSGYRYAGQAYIFGHSAMEDGVGSGMWFIQEITYGGKLGAETSHGIMDGDDSFFFPFNME